MQVNSNNSLIIALFKYGLALLAMVKCLLITTCVHPFTLYISFISHLVDIYI